MVELFFRHRWHPIVIYTALFVCWFTPGILTRSVIMPFNPAEYANSTNERAAAYVQSNHFDDYTTSFIPEVFMHMESPRSGWLATWTNRVEMGRPLGHLSGSSPAYIVTWILQMFIHDAFVFFTAMFMLLVYLAGLFALLFVRHTTQQTIHAVTAGVFLAFSPYLFFWNSFFTFGAALTWGMALVYGITRLAQRQSLGNFLLTTFSMYSIIYTVYPQVTIHLAYLIGGYTAWLIWRLPEWQQRWRFMATCAGAGVCAIVLCLPVIRDIVVQMELSDLRALVPQNFFSQGVQVINTPGDIVRTVVGYLFSPVMQPTPEFTKFAYPITRQALVSTLVFWGVVGAYFAWRQVWGWVVWLFFAAVLSLHRPIFEFAIQLGLPQFSRGFILWSAPQYIPHIMLAIAGLVQSNTAPLAQRQRGGIWIGAAFLALLGLSCVVAYIDGKTIQWAMVACELLVIGASTWLLTRTANHWQQIAILAVVVIQAIVLAQPYLLQQPISHAVYTSPTVREIVSRIPEGGRFALVYRKPARQLEANYTAVLGINNVGAYSSLPSRYYVALMQQFGVPYDKYTRNIRSIPATFPPSARWWANVYVVVSDAPHDFVGATRETRSNGLYIYRYPDAMGCCRLVAQADATRQSDTHWQVTDTVITQSVPLTYAHTHGDNAEIILPAATPAGIIVLSQAYHPDWHAFVETAEGRIPVETVVVNDSYQGIRIPAEARSVILEFTPWIWWSWLAHLFWGIAICAYVWHNRSQMPSIPTYRNV